MWNCGGGPRDYVWVKVRPKPWRAAQLGIKGSHPRPVGHRASETRKGRAAQLCRPSSCFCVFRPRGSTRTHSGVCASCGPMWLCTEAAPPSPFCPLLGLPPWRDSGGTPTHPVGLEALSPGLATSLCPSSPSHVCGPWPFPLSPISDSH